jgi:hypothetical protein
MPGMAELATLNALETFERFRHFRVRTVLDMMQRSQYIERTHQSKMSCPIWGLCIAAVKMGFKFCLSPSCNGNFI